MTNQTPQVNNLFLIGAGFTRAIFPKEPLKAPLNKDLLPIICKNAPSITTTLKKYYKELNKIKDIEILLTRLDLELQIPKATRQTALQTARKVIEQQLAEYFQQFRFNGQVPQKNGWLEDFALKLFSDNDAIISLNYDCFLEGLLDYYGLWSPKGGYVNVSNILDEDVPENTKNILIYKIHGSENFWIAPGLPNRNKEFIGLIINGNIFPRSGKNLSIEYGGGQPEVRSYIIAPSFVKIPHIQIVDMVNKAIEVSKTAQNLIICGSSLRNEDGFLRLILTSFMNKELQNKKKLIIIDPNADAILEKIKIFWVGSTEHMHFIPIPKRIDEGLEDLIELL